MRCELRRVAESAESDTGTGTGPLRGGTFIMSDTAPSGGVHALIFSAKPSPVDGASSAGCRAVRRRSRAGKLAPSRLDLSVSESTSCSPFSYDSS